MFPEILRIVTPDDEKKNNDDDDEPVEDQLWEKVMEHCKKENHTSTSVYEENHCVVHGWTADTIEQFKLIHPTVSWDSRPSSAVRPIVRESSVPKTVQQVEGQIPTIPVVISHVCLDSFYELITTDHSITTIEQSAPALVPLFDPVEKTAYTHEHIPFDARDHIIPLTVYCAAWRRYERLRRFNSLNRTKCAPSWTARETNRYSSQLKERLKLHSDSNIKTRISDFMKIEIRSGAYEKQPTSDVEQFMMDWMIQSIEKEAIAVHITALLTMYLTLWCCGGPLFTSDRLIDAIQKETDRMNMKPLTVMSPLSLYDHKEDEDKEVVSFQPKDDQTNKRTLLSSLSLYDHKEEDKEVVSFQPKDDQTNKRTLLSSNGQAEKKQKPNPSVIVIDDSDSEREDEKKELAVVESKSKYRYTHGMSHSETPRILVAEWLVNHVVLMHYWHFCFPYLRSLSARRAPSVIRSLKNQPPTLFHYHLNPYHDRYTAYYQSFESKDETVGRLPFITPNFESFQGISIIREDKTINFTRLVTVTASIPERVRCLVLPSSEQKVPDSTRFKLASTAICPWSPSAWKVWIPLDLNEKDCIPTHAEWYLLETHPRINEQDVYARCEVIPLMILSIFFRKIEDVHFHLRFAPQGDSSPFERTYPSIETYQDGTDMLFDDSLLLKVRSGIYGVKKARSMNTDEEEASTVDAPMDDFKTIVTHFPVAKIASEIKLTEKDGRSDQERLKRLCFWMTLYHSLVVDRSSWIDPPPPSQETTTTISYRKSSESVIPSMDQVISDHLVKMCTDLKLDEIESIRDRTHPSISHLIDQVNDYRRHFKTDPKLEALRSAYIHARRLQAGTPLTESMTHTKFVQHVSMETANVSMTYEKLSTICLPFVTSKQSLPFILATTLAYVSTPSTFVVPVSFRVSESFF
jgi:hypothetical protein